MTFLDPWRYVRDLKRYSAHVLSAARGFGPDLVYSEGPLVYAYLRAQRRAPVIFHPHGLEMFQHKGSLFEDAKSLPLRDIIRAHARRADIVLSQGGDLDRLLQRAGAAKEKIRLLPNSSERRAATACRSRKAAPRNQLLFVARDEKRKGLEVLLKAVERLGFANLTVVGVERARTRSRNVTFMGVVRDRETLQAMFDRADFLVVPSHAEGMPTVILEALATGLPVIASDVGAVREAVIDGETGFLAQPGDVARLAQAIGRATEQSKSQYEAMSTACRALFEKRFAPERVRDELLGIVDQAMVG